MKKLILILGFLLMVGSMMVNAAINGCSPANSDCSNGCDSIFNSPGSTWGFSDDGWAEGGYCYENTNVYKIYNDTFCDGLISSPSDGECAEYYWGYISEIGDVGIITCPSYERNVDSQVYDGNCMCMTFSSGGYVSCSSLSIYPYNYFNLMDAFFTVSNYTVPSYTVTTTVSTYAVHDTSGAIGGTTTDTTLTIKDGSTSLVEFEIDASADLSTVIVTTDGTRTVVSGLNTSITGVTGTHSLYVPTANTGGVYVCPDENILSNVVYGCSNMVNFTEAECGSSTERNGLTCTIVGSYYKVSGLTGSGVGGFCNIAADCTDAPTCDEQACICVSNECVLDASPAIPEFGFIGTLLSIVIITVFSMAIWKKK